VSELYDIFVRIKELLYEKKFEKLDLPELVELILKENKTKKDLETLKSVYEYVVGMEKSLEDLGTIVYEMMSFSSSTSIVEIETKVRGIVLTVDQFIDGLAAVIRVVKFSESKLKLKQSLAYLKSIRGLIINKTNEYKLKIGKTSIDSDTFLRFLTDTIDTFLREAYIIRILKIKDVIQKTIDINHD